MHSATPCITIAALAFAAMTLFQPSWAQVPPQTDSFGEEDWIFEKSHSRTPRANSDKERRVACQQAMTAARTDLNQEIGKLSKTHYGYDPTNPDTRARADWLRVQVQTSKIRVLGCKCTDPNHATGAAAICKATVTLEPRSPPGSN